MHNFKFKKFENNWDHMENWYKDYWNNKTQTQVCLTPVNMLTRKWKLLKLIKLTVNGCVVEKLDVNKIYKHT